MRLHTKGLCQRSFFFLICWLTTSEKDTRGLMMDSVLLMTDTRKQAIDSTGQSRIVRFLLDNGHEDPL